MKLALEFAALLIAFLCFSTALKAFLHLQHHEWRLSQRHKPQLEGTEDTRSVLDHAA